MDLTKAELVARELTMILMYLSRFKENNRFSTEGDDYYAWKGYAFDILNALDDSDFIRQGSHPSKSKSVYITGSGISYAKGLMEKYGISDRE